MEWISKLISTLKIPMKILLPSTCLFSAIMIFSNDTILEKLNLLDWSKEYGFVFGLLFLITACLILIYAIKECHSRLKKLLWKLSYKRKTMKRILEMSPMEASIIFKLYNVPGYTYGLDFNKPAVKALSAKNYIYSGGTQVATVGWYDEIYIQYMLQPFVAQTLNHYKEKFENKIKKLKQKLAKEKNQNKVEKIKTELQTYQEMYTGMFNGGLENE